MERYLIINADDFGASRGINRGILECHVRGVVTSASLMVTGRAAQEAADISLAHPALSIGLHWDVIGEDERTFDLGDLAAVRDELRRQLDRFLLLMGRPPTHIDSHRHVHRLGSIAEPFREWVEPLGVPLRGQGPVRCVGCFYGQWEWQKTDLTHVSVEYLQHMLRTETAQSWTEFSCHPGYPSDDFHSVYLLEREVEVRTLTDPRIRDAIEKEGLRLASYSLDGGLGTGSSQA